jgi:hypothetical protein
MRLAAAALATTGVPMLVGSRWVVGSWYVRLSLGGLIGVVFLSVGSYLGALAGVLPVGALVGLAAAWLIGPQVSWAPRTAAPSPLARRVLSLVLVAGGVLLLLSLFRPVAHWDAWFQWSIKAKALADAGGFYAPVFLNPVYEYARPEYPPLLASWQAVAYLISGDLTVSWPLQFQQAWLWTVGGIGLLLLTLSHGRWAFAMPAAWLLSPQVVWQSIQGYADVPMALLILTGTLVVWKAPDRLPNHVVGGVLLAGGALMKNEGLPLVAVILACLLLGRSLHPRLLVAPAVVLCLFLPWLVFTRLNQLATDIIVERRSIIAELGTRIPLIAGRMTSAMLSPMLWGMLTPGALATMASRRRVDVRLAAAAVLTLLPFVGIYLVTPYDLPFHLTVSVHRVLITPIGLLALAAGVSADIPAEQAREAVDETRS